MKADPAVKGMLAYKNTAAFTALQKVLFNQLFVSQNNRIPGDPQLFGQLAGRGQTSPGRERAGKNSVDQFLPDLTLQIKLAAGVKVDQRFSHQFGYPRFMMRPFCRSQSRSFSVLRLSCWRLPLAIPISTLTFPRYQYMAVGTTV